MCNNNITHINVSIRKLMHWILEYSHQCKHTTNKPILLQKYYVIMLKILFHRNNSTFYCLFKFINSRSFYFYKFFGFAWLDFRVIKVLLMILWRIEDLFFIRTEREKRRFLTKYINQFSFRVNMLLYVIQNQLCLDMLIWYLLFCGMILMKNDDDEIWADRTVYFICSI